MSDKKKNKSGKKEKSNLTIVLTFLIMLLVSYLVGYAGGGLAAKTTELKSFDSFVKVTSDFAYNGLPILFIIVSVAGIIIPLYYFFKCKKLYKKLQSNMEDDDLWDELEDKLNYPMITASLFMRGNLCLFFCYLYELLMTNYGSASETNKIIGITAFLLYVLSAAVDTIISTLTVEIEKKLNPEKKGHMLDINFKKDWLATCDEAEKAIIYRAGYGTFEVTNIICTILFLVSFFASFVF